MLKSLFWRISLIFLLVLILLTGVFFLIVANTATKYQQETALQLSRGMAPHIVAEADFHPFNGSEVDSVYIQHLFHNVMIYNPATELYLLDEKGKILKYVAPHREVTLTEVDLQPIREFLADTSQAFITGPDPSAPEASKPFSVQEIVQGNDVVGYIYIVLQGQKYTSATDQVAGSYVLKLGTRTMLLAVVAALVVGLLLIWLLTRSLGRIISVVQRFRNGDHAARIELQSQGELTQLADNFNEMADTIVKHINEIKSVEQLRRELIANVSHDLRTPLSAIQGYAETLVMKHDHLAPEDQLKYTKVILNSTERIRKLVEDLFELSKLESLQVNTNFEAFSLAELVQDITAKYAILAEQHNIHLQTEIPQHLPAIYADIALMDRVLQNLMDNALKNTPAGGKVTIALKPVGKGMEVRVADTGIGIAENELPYIFDRYRKAGSKKKEGTGLGLAIVKKILEMHESQIHVSSKLNAGTEFWFVVPTGFAQQNG